MTIDKHIMMTCPVRVHILRPELMVKVYVSLFGNRFGKEFLITVLFFCKNIC